MTVFRSWLMVPLAIALIALLLSAGGSAQREAWLIAIGAGVLVAGVQYLWGLISPS